MARAQRIICIPGRPYRFQVQEWAVSQLVRYLLYKMWIVKIEEMNDKESDSFIVAVK